MSIDDIEWEGPPEDDYVEWESPRFEQPPPPPFNPVRAITRLVRRIPSRWVIVALLIGLVATSSIAMIQAQQIAILNSELDELQDEYDILLSQYDDLLSQYDSLFSNHEALKEAFEDPLTNPVTPTYSHLLTWLAQDDTDHSAYVDGVWTCGDFAAMLMTRAKEMNWRIRIAVISYSLEGDLYYGSTWPYGSQGGHAFNVIECTDGVWYIEPQSDGTWYVIDGVTEERIEFEPFEYYDSEDSNLGTIWDGYSWWTNYYNQFA